MRLPTYLPTYLILWSDFLGLLNDARSTVFQTWASKHAVVKTKLVQTINPSFTWF